MQHIANAAEQLEALLEQQLAEMQAEHEVFQCRAEEFVGTPEAAEAHIRAEALSSAVTQGLSLIGFIGGIGNAVRAFRAGSVLEATGSAAGGLVSEFLNVFFGWDGFVADMDNLKDYINLTADIATVEQGREYVEHRIRRLEDLKDRVRQSCDHPTSDYG
ncbi:hypothetical protein [Aliiroseovarius crassostreae]|uniref:hypothetical protein n=1 Tax=Aliiroseovarius crassostreae TaxID=154981 RepID=UPI0021FC8972|nr:hypothetical protein [Aliiroseovarius crassostreae]UWP88496.1 hypothetical protein K3J57_11400 [Aliiroseovarius crassostreae]UWQ01150.1 hypothetical protein K3X44_11680 [Aliiroseovarius crassostreae]